MSRIMEYDDDGTLLLKVDPFLKFTTLHYTYICIICSPSEALGSVILTSPQLPYIMNIYTGAGATGRTGRGSASLGPGRLSVYHSARSSYNRVGKY